MFFWDPTILILIPGIIITVIAQSMVTSAYNQYSRVRTRNGLTGAMAAEDIMRANGLGGVRIVQIGGSLTDNYNPRDKIMSLSVPVATGANVAAVGIAAHETGHALQDQQAYWPIKFRNAIVPVCGFCSSAAWPLFIIGFFLARTGSIGFYLMDGGIILFTVSLLFYLITLPVEFNASRRAVTAIEELHLLDPDELQGVKKVLRAAALTYVASMLAALLNLVRLLVLRGNRQ